eukprot:8116-Heterococcus_DN1.PRE.3
MLVCMITDTKESSIAYISQDYNQNEVRSACKSCKSTIIIALCEPVWLSAVKHDWRHMTRARSVQHRLSLTICFKYTKLLVGTVRTNIYANAIVSSRGRAYDTQQSHCSHECMLFNMSIVTTTRARKATANSSPKALKTAAFFALAALA